MKTAAERKGRLVVAQVLSVALLVVLCSSCVYLKMDPPADADKAAPPPGIVNNSCWLATAANMLAGAGYGDGDTLQDRAEDIYADLIAWRANLGFGIDDGGWTDTAVTWWLGSNHNTWPNNPYTDVQVYGNKFPRFPWANTSGARFIANQLRECEFLGVSISWPTNNVDAFGNPIIGSGGHAITGWGDNVAKEEALTFNPSQVKLTDSDRETSGDVQTYTYDSYTNPNPSGASEGNGWYMDYDPNHPYIKHIVTLCPTELPTGGKATQKVVGSYRIHQLEKVGATDLHYKVGTDTTILSYKTKIDWQTNTPPSITEDQPQRRELAVEWDLSENPVPFCTWVTITTDFILRVWNAIEYEDVRFTYPRLRVKPVVPALRWEIKTPQVRRAESIPNVTGGYVVGSFDVVGAEQLPEAGPVAQYRLIHQYSFAQSPEQHVFALTGERGFAVTNLRFGHTYGLLDTEALWDFDDWMTELPGKRFPLGEAAVSIQLDWKGRLPYPEGEDIRGRIPDIKTGLMRRRVR